VGANVVVTGSGAVTVDPKDVESITEQLPAFDSKPFLKKRKLSKFMGKQDHMAVIAATKAVRQAALPPEILRERCGVYLAVSYIPFERELLERLAWPAVDQGRFSMDRFSRDALPQVNPLVTFRCLPNMPAFHISMNLGIQGPGFTTYPGPAQLYLALEEGVAALRRGEIDAALVGGVADQNNFLVEQVRQMDSGAPPRRVADAAAFVILERESDVRSRNLPFQWRLWNVDIEYAPPNSTNASNQVGESFCQGDTEYTSVDDAYLGPASLPWQLHRRNDLKSGQQITHAVTTGDGYRAGSQWSVC
jgi:hypothetical protein